MAAQLSVRYESGIQGKKADVYRNLQTGGYSIRSRETETYGTVIGHEDAVVVENAEFVVQEKGRQRVLEEERKNVHAVVRGVVGKLSDWDDVSDTETVPVTYNPYEYAHFVHAETEEPIESAETVLIGENGVFAVGVEYLN